jgi:hypothetical protein
LHQNSSFQQKILIFLQRTPQLGEEARQRGQEPGNGEIQIMKKTKPMPTFRNVVARLSILQENCSKEKKMLLFFFSLLLEKFGHFFTKLDSKVRCSNLCFSDKADISLLQSAEVTARLFFGIIIELLQL